MQWLVLQRKGSLHLAKIQEDRYLKGTSSGHRFGVGNCIYLNCSQETQGRFQANNNKLCKDNPSVREEDRNREDEARGFQAEGHSSSLAGRN